MKSIYTLTVGGKEYKLRLTTSAVMATEKRLGKSMLTALENIEENMMETLITVLWGAMQAFNDNISFEDVAELIDQYIDDGQSIENLMGEVYRLLEVSGFFTGGQA